MKETFRMYRTLIVKMFRQVLIILLFWGVHIVWAQTSVLSSGSWYKIGITETGIYKIDKPTLDALGISGSIDPDKIQLYGNALKGILPQSNAMDRPQDLTENAIFISGGNDGSFDPDDYILFYGVGPHKEMWTSQGFEYAKNIYSDTAYYFLRIDGANGKRITTKETMSGTPSATVTTFQDHKVYEDDRTNLISSGRGWYGETLSSGESLTFSYQLEGLISPITMSLSTVSQSSEGGTFQVVADGTQIGSISIDPVPDGPGTTYNIKARQASGVFTFPATSTFDLTISFDGGASGERGFVDFYTLTFERSLRLYTNETAFRWYMNPGELLQYEIDNASGSTIWDVTSPTEIKEQSYTQSGSKAIFKSQHDDVEEYVTFKGSDFPTPFVFGTVANQNLRGNTSIDAIVVTHPAFKEAAMSLADFHEMNDGLTIQVATTTQVYNEFSGGRQDVSAIRDYARYVYESGGNLKYLLLLGDCSYDYKDRIINNTNFVPTYESRESFHPIYSYSSDDYFGFLEPDEGDWVESVSGDHTLEIGIGRLPAKSAEEAQAMVDKIIHYSTSPKTLGKWRNEITYVGDDGDGNIHARHVEDLSALVDTTYAQYNITKILIDAFVQEASGSSEKSPQAKAALKTRIKEGTFMVNFIGHGNERVWTEEEVLTLADINELTNRNKLPIFVTATCEFGRYDDPVRVSGAEQLLLMPQGGGIALLTTSRPVFASTNFSLNRAFHENIFRKEAGKNLRLGDVIRFTKNEGLEGPVNRNFTLLGDPMMMPAYPQLDIKINEWQNTLDTLSALERVTLTGRIEENGELRSDFNGRLVVNVFDVPQNFKTKGQESAPYTYTARSNALFRGESVVSGGVFEISFVVPKNISYQYQKGKMSLYAWDETNNVDAGGASRSFVIGGTSAINETDQTPPAIRMYMNDETFKDGGVVGQSPLLIAHVEDESGITTARSGVVEGIVLRLDNQMYNLNEFYTAHPDDFTQGTIVFPIQDLAPGTYTATLKVWDTYNNASESAVRFTVTDQPVLFVYDPIAYPNPVKEHVTLAFDHDREDEDLEVTVLVYGPLGNVVYKNLYEIEGASRRVEISWQALGNGGEALREGIYYSRLIIRSKLDGATKEITKKLVIVN